MGFGVYEISKVWQEIILVIIQAFALDLPAEELLGVSHARMNSQLGPGARY